MIVLLYIVIALGLVVLVSQLIYHIAKGRRERRRIRVEEKAHEDVERMIAVLVADRELARHFQERLSESLEEQEHYEDSDISPNTLSR